MENFVEERLSQFEREVRRVLTKGEPWYIDSQEYIDNCMFCFNIKHKNDNTFSGRICLHERDNKFDFMGRLNNNFENASFFAFSKRFPDDLIYLPLFIKQNTAARQYFEFFRPSYTQENNKYQIGGAFSFSITESSILDYPNQENKEIVNLFVGSLNNFVNSNSFLSFAENIVHSFTYEEKDKDFISFLFSKMISNLPDFVIDRRKLGFLYEKGHLNFNYMAGGTYFQSFYVSIERALEDFILFIGEFLNFIKENSKSNVLCDVKVLDELSWLSFDNMFLNKIENLFIDKSLLYYNIDYYNREISFDAKNYIIFSKVMALLLQGFLYSYKVAKMVYKEDVSMCCLVRSKRNISFFLPVINHKEKLDSMSYLSYIQISMGVL